MDRNGRALPLLDDETRAVKSARFSTQRWITKAVLLENAAPLVQRRTSTCSEISFARDDSSEGDLLFASQALLRSTVGPPVKGDYHSIKWIL